jgi:hypothetical protein
MVMENSFIFFFYGFEFFPWLLGGRGNEALTQPKKTLEWAPPTLHLFPDCEHIYWSYNMGAHHSKDHRGIDFEPLVTEEEVRLVKAWKFH